MTILFIGEYFWVWLICLIVVIIAWVLYKMAAIPSWILHRKNKIEKEKNEADAAVQKAGYRNYAEWDMITREAENLEAREHGYRNYKEWQEAKRLAKEEREDEIQDDRDFEAQLRGYDNYEEWQKFKRLEEQEQECAEGLKQAKARRKRLIEQERERIRKGE